MQLYYLLCWWSCAHKSWLSVTLTPSHSHLASTLHQQQQLRVELVNTRHASFKKLLTIDICCYCSFLYIFIFRFDDFLSYVMWVWMKGDQILHAVTIPSFNLSCHFQLDVRNIRYQFPHKHQSVGRGQRVITPAMICYHWSPCIYTVNTDHPVSHCAGHYQCYHHTTPRVGAVQSMHLECKYLQQAAVILELETNVIRRFAKFSPSLMIIASASQFQIYLPWGQRPFIIVS